MKAVDLALEFSKAGVEAIICTDISGIDTIASGGVKDMDDIIKCKKSGDIAGVIVGKAFYEGTIDLEKAFKVI